MSMSMQLVRLESALKYHVCLLQNHVLKHYITNIFTILKPVTFDYPLKTVLILQRDFDLKSIVSHLYKMTDVIISHMSYIMALRLTTGT